MQLKYIMVDNLYPVIFSPAIEHRKLDSAGRITSAGFVEIRANDGRLTARTSGRSFSLGMDPHADDASKIELAINRRETAWSE